MENWGSNTNSRMRHLVVLLLLLGLLLFPWADGLTPAVNPLRFLSKLPFPAGNILFACYLVVSYLNLHQLIYQQKDEKMVWFRYFLALGAMGAILRIFEVSDLTLSLIVAFAWLTLSISAFWELRFLYRLRPED